MLTVNKYIKRLSVLLILSITLTGLNLYSSECMCSGECKLHRTYSSADNHEKCLHKNKLQHQNLIFLFDSIRHKECHCKELGDLSYYWHLIFHNKDISKDIDNHNYLVYYKKVKIGFCCSRKNFEKVNSPLNPLMVQRIW